MNQRPIAGRYRIIGTLRSEGNVEVHVCEDLTLGRRVRVRVFDESVDPAVAQSKVSAVATLTHPRIARVFDSGWDGGRFYVVSEHAASDLASNPPGPDVGRAVIEQASQAINYAHERGVVHGQLTAHHLLATESGVKVDGFGTADLAGVEAVDDHAALRAIAAALGTPRASKPTAPAQPRPDKRNLVWIAAAAVLFAVAIGWTLRSPGKPTPDGTTPVPPDSQRIAISNVADFDPLGDSSENRSRVERVYDGDPGTFWTTETYRGSAVFNGAKDGVGVILHFDSPQLVGFARVRTPVAGCDIEIRTAPNRLTDPNDWDTIAELPGAGVDSVVEFPATRSNWWLVWITKLATGVPGSGNGFACGIGEVDLYAP